MSRRNRLRVGSMVRHRRITFEQAFDRLIKGEVTPGYVQQRGDKLKEIQRSVIGKRN